MLRKPALGLTALLIWVVGQALWLQQGYQLEFLGQSAFVPGLWLASVVFFGANSWILGIIVGDITGSATPQGPAKATSGDKNP